MMDRRKAVRAMAVVGAASLAARAQVPGRVYRVGHFGFTATNTPEDDRVWGAFVQRLRELGFTEGGNLVIENKERNRGLAQSMTRQSWSAALLKHQARCNPNTGKHHEQSP